MMPIKFGTDGWRAIIAEQFTLANLTRVTVGTARYLHAHHTQPTVMIGYDCRFHGRYFAETVANILAQEGIRVFLPPDFASTPMVSLAVHKRQCSAGIVITASHNPPEYSGFKLKGWFGGPAFPADIAELESYIPDTPPTYENQLDSLYSQGMISTFDMEALYLNHIKQNFDLALIRKSGIKLGYDAMYGAGQAAFRKLFPQAELLHCEFNPSFMGTAPEPIEKNLLEFQQRIRSHGIQVGLATDGDADRIGLFDEHGNFVDSHHILLLLVHYLCSVRKQTGKVVFTFSVSPRLAKLCRHYNLPFEITKVGFKYICEIMLREDVLVAGEESGGIAIQGHVPERDGIYIGLTIVEMMARSGKSLTELVQEIYSIVGEFSFQRRDLHLTDAQKQAVISLLKSGTVSQLGTYSVRGTEDLDGFKFLLDNEQWVMVRPSGTEPVLRIYAESATRAGAEAILDATVATLLQPQPQS